MNIEYYVKLIINLSYMLFMILHAFPLLVDALAKYMLVTPRVSIYAR